MWQIIKDDCPMKLKQIFIIPVLMILLSSTLLAQFGTIQGTVTEMETGEKLVGATVRVLLDSTMKSGAYTDDEGNFKVERLVPATYDLVISYVGYDPVTIQGVQVVAGQVAVRDLKLGVDLEDDGEKNKVEITSRVTKTSETSVLTIQRKSANVMDGISFDQVRRAGDSNAGAAIRRVTGVTVEGGKYVYVRGLGDRYTKALLNGGEVPSLDPDRNSVQMDMFPANLIDNIVVYKTFTPDLPGSFSGGLIDISTKDFPEAFTFQYTGSVGYNTQSSLRSDFLSYQTGRMDWLGMDDGTRGVPAEVTNGIPGTTATNEAQAQQLDAATKSFQTGMAPSRAQSGLDYSHAFSLGNQGKLLGRPLGYIASVSYSNSYEYYDNGVTGRYRLTDLVNNVNNLNREIMVRDQSGQRNVLWGGLFNLSYMPAPKQKIAINYLRNQSGTSGARTQEGVLARDDQGLYYQTNRVDYTQRSMDAIQLKGDHVLDGANGLHIDYIGSVTFSSQNEPDLRFFTYDYTIQNGDTLFDIQPNLYDPPSRYFREMREYNLDAKLNVELPIALSETKTLKVKVGGAMTTKNREFSENRYEYDYNSNNVTFTGDAEAFFAEENLGLMNNEPPFTYGIFIKDASETRNQYSAEQSIAAGYGMVDLPLTQKLKFIGGARYELTDIYVVSKDQSLKPGLLTQGDILPSANLTYTANEFLKFRTNWSRTLARPVFRELAPFNSFDFVGDFVLIGNPYLQRTLIDNFDLRAEWYPTPSEIISVSGFYKHFQNPIERVINTGSAGATEQTFRNVDEATVVGVELEIKKKLSFLPGQLKHLRIGANGSLIRSVLAVDAQELILNQALNPDAPTTRPMFGQSPYSVNGELAYLNDTTGWAGSVNFNVFGPRIAAVVVGGGPNVYEKARPSLDVTVSKMLFDRLTLRLRARNLLNPEYKLVQEFKGNENVFQSYTVGRSFTLGISYAFK